MALPAQAQEGTFSVKSMTPETAVSAARAALEHCRRQGYQVAVAVVDRSGVLQALIRDRFAGAHTVEVASAAVAMRKLAEVQALLVATSTVCAPAKRSRISACRTPERSTTATATW